MDDININPQSDLQALGFRIEPLFSNAVVVPFAILWKYIDS